MKSKRLFQIFVLLVMLFSSVGSVQPASASTGREAVDAVVIDRNLKLLGCQLLWLHQLRDLRKLALRVYRLA